MRQINAKKLAKKIEEEDIETISVGDPTNGKGNTVLDFETDVWHQDEGNELWFLV